MSESTPLVSVVIVNWNGIEDTKECLKYLKNQTYRNFETIVVDNGSHDGSVSYLRSVKGIILVENHKNLGFTGGHIAGYKASNGDFILLLNNDAIADKKYIEKAVKGMLADEQIGALGGRAYLWDDDNPLFESTNKFYAYQNINPITGEGIFAQKDEGVPREVNNVSGSCVLVRRSIIEKIGYLHDPFFAYYEESDLFARMKRAGYKVMYDPDLAIWHANAKSSSRKAPTFSLYMMMRNRFRFAVRNFDNWSLARFIKFYLKMGAVSSIKALLPSQKYYIDRAYARAFWRNFFLGWVAFKERYVLKKKHGLHINYNARIKREQTSISVVVKANDKHDVDTWHKASEIINPWDEIIMVVKEEELITYARKFCDIDTERLRLCIDRGLFSGHSINIGIVCAKGEWLLLGANDKLASRDNWLTQFDSVIYEAQSNSKDLVYTTSENSKILSPQDVHNFNRFSQILAKSTLCADAGGFSNEVSLTDAWRALVGYVIAYNRALGFCVDYYNEMPGYSSTIKPFDSMVAEIRSMVDESSRNRKKPGLLKQFLLHHYRAQQLYFLTVWLFSPKIPLRLKLARLKNIITYTLTLKRKLLALELKHVRNEVSHTKYGTVDLDKRKKNEKIRLEYLQDNPTQTTVFIITRDRYQPLKELVGWLEKQGMERIAFVDNDSALPPLMDFLKQTKYQVLETRQNAGHTALWSLGIVKTLLPDDFYIVSDPDVVPVKDSVDVVSRLYDIHRRFPDHLKVGLGLKIDDLPNEYELKNEVMRWEDQFWKHSLGDNIYEAGVDTTFALYKPFTHSYFIHPSIRTGEPYTARHLPWYNVSKKLTDEDIFYRLRADQNVNTWDKDKLPQKYVKELEKQRH